MIKSLTVYGVQFDAHLFVFIGNSAISCVLDEDICTFTHIKYILNTMHLYLNHNSLSARILHRAPPPPPGSKWTKIF